MSKDTTLFGHNLVDYLVIGMCLLSIILAPIGVILAFIKLAKEIQGDKHDSV